MNDEEIQQAPGRILHLPTVLGAVVPIYNLPDVKDELKFDGQVLVDIFLGRAGTGTIPRLRDSTAASSCLPSRSRS
jgi:phosphate transport system substrate-binding protein